MKFLGLILVPVICAVAALNGGGYLPHVGVPVTCILLVAFLCGREVRRTNWMLIAALLFSIAGDWMLKHRGGDEMRFIYGIALFFIAHVGYLAFCLRNGRIKWLWLTALLVGYGLFFALMLVPAIRGMEMRIAVLLYMLISCFSLAAAPGLRFSPAARWLFTAGIACIVFSDTLIALYEFPGKAQWLYAHLMMPTYYAAHILVTAAVLAVKSE
ncbi:MAG: lysoplasmalogenase [Tannerella sp.]|nr:lysoplasmalogenase [Tannerella sp.]